MNKLNTLRQLVHYFGIRWVAYRLWNAVQIKTGLTRRALPAYEWGQRPLADWLRADVAPMTAEAYVAYRRQGDVRFFFDTLPTEALTDTRPAVVAADAILNGVWPYFTASTFEVGMPPNWHQNPARGVTIGADRHWTQINDFEAGDIKFIWEANRFTVVFALVRAYAATEDRRYADAYRQLVTDWRENNPPLQGPNWKCGQESTFRVMAWTFGLYAFLDVLPPQTVCDIVAMIAAHGERIEQHIQYARSQNNNHGVSEGVGLWTIGLLFPELDAAERWREHGRRVVIEEVSRQVYTDGTYAQYSPNYQRVMLHGVVWALRLGELNNRRFPQDVYDKVARSVQFLTGILDPTGWAPLHGFNDSAYLLPLSSPPARDHRPALQLAHYLTDRTRLFDTVYDDLIWLFGPEAATAPAHSLPVAALAAERSGYYTLRADESWLMARCAAYATHRDARPHHADQLHVDLWWRGHNVLCDAGTYLYNGDGPWRNGLATTRVHNTVTVDDQDQMRPYSHFMWLDWSDGVVQTHEADRWVGQHGGYRRLADPVTHQREVRRVAGDVWLIVDHLTAAAPHHYSLRWLMPDWPMTVDDTAATLQTPSGDFQLTTSGPITHHRAMPDRVIGWRAPAYGVRVPAHALHVTTDGAVSTRFWTVVGPWPLVVTPAGDDQLQIDGQMHDLRLPARQIERV